MRFIAAVLMVLGMAGAAHADSNVGPYPLITISSGTAPWWSKANYNWSVISTMSASQFNSNTFGQNGSSNTFVNTLWMNNSSFTLSGLNGAIYMHPGRVYTSTWSAQGFNEYYGLTASTLTATTSLTVPGGFVATSTGAWAAEVGVGADSTLSANDGLYTVDKSQAWKASAAALDEKTWDCAATGSSLFQCRAVNDAYNAASPWVQVARSGTTVGNVTFPGSGVTATAITVPGGAVLTSTAADFVGIMTLGSPASDGIIQSYSGVGLDLAAPTQNQYVAIGDRQTKFNTLEVINGQVSANGPITVAGSSVTVNGEGSDGVAISGIGSGNTFIKAKSLSGGNSGYQFDNGTNIEYLYRIGDDVRFQDTTGDQVTFKNGGNVGIGTASPATKLHMSSGTLTVDGTGAAMNIAGSTFTVANSGIISAPSQPGIRTRLVTTQALPSTVTTKIFFGDNACSNGCYQHNIGGYDNSVASGTFKANGTGLYAVNCTLVFTGAASGTLLTITVADDASNTNTYAQDQRTAGSSNTLVFSASGFAWLTDGQTAQCNARADTSSVSVAGSLNSFMVLQKLW